MDWITLGKDSEASSNSDSVVCENYTPQDSLCVNQDTQYALFTDLREKIGVCGEMRDQSGLDCEIPDKLLP